MRRVAVAFFLVSALALSGAGQDKGKDEKGKKDDSKEVTKSRGQLPANWKELGLTDDQKKKFYALQSSYNEHADKLKAQLAELKEKYEKERSQLLTADQKKRLQDILAAKAGVK